MRRYELLIAIWLSAGTSIAWAESTATFRVTDAKGQQIPCRIHIYDAQGKPQRPAELPYWRDHFVCDGSASIKLPPGKFRYEIERGPEWTAAKSEFTIEENETHRLAETLTRIADLAGEGWWSGETHIHRSLQDIELLMRAEDLHLGAVSTWWNKKNDWLRTAIPDDRVRVFDGNRFYHMLAGEDERGGGALMLLNLREPLKIADAAREWPPSAQYLTEAKTAGAWVVSSPRVRCGCFRILNCGLRIPPSAGSASGVLPNPVGYNRAYVARRGTISNLAAGPKLRRPAHLCSDRAVVCRT